jgi:hypothetical protein
MLLLGLTPTVCYARFIVGTLTNALSTSTGYAHFINAYICAITNNTFSRCCEMLNNDPFRWRTTHDQERDGVISLHHKRLL